MHKELEYMHSVISLESQSDATVASAAERIPGFLDKITEFFTQNVAQPIGTLFSRKDVVWMADNASRRPFNEMRGYRVYVPVGFKGSLADYGQLLLEAAGKMDRILDEVLVPYGRWVAEKVSNPKSLSNLTNTLQIPGLKDLDIRPLEVRLDAFFPDRNRHTTAIYGEVFARQQDWERCSSALRKLEDLYKNGRYDRTRAKVRELSELLEKLAVVIRENRIEYQVSSVTIKQLSDITFEIAKMVEFYGILRHRVDEYARSMQDTVDELRPKM